VSLQKVLYGAKLAVVLTFASLTSYAAVPTISGSPSEIAPVGSTYSFTPRASDADGDRLRFSITRRPDWATFDATTGKLSGTPTKASTGVYTDIRIAVTDGTSTRALPNFDIHVSSRKANYGHYFALRYGDTEQDVAMLCEQQGVKGIVRRTSWKSIESSAGVYDFSLFDRTLRAIANSHNPRCQLWILVDYKSFNGSPDLNPCPNYLQAAHSARNADSNRGSTCFMWEPVVLKAYIAMMRAAAARFDNNPRVEGFVWQESALGFYDAYSQDVADGGTYTAVAWRDALIDLVQACSAAFSHSRCMAFLNFIRNGQQYVADVSRAIDATPANRVCLSGPDVLPDERPLYANNNAIYEVLTRHPGCRANSIQNDSYSVSNFGLNSVFKFAAGGTYGNFDQSAPRQSGLCVNSYLFWNHRVNTSRTGLDWHDALPVIAAYPYGREWLGDCQNGGGAP
jgi:hypothetical protein